MFLFSTALAKRYAYLGLSIRKKVFICQLQIFTPKKIHPRMGCCCSCCPCCADEINHATSWDFSRGRRLALSSVKLECPDNVIIEEEYVQAPDGHILFTRCYLPKTDDKTAKGMICYNHGYADHLDNLMHDVGVEWCKRGFIFFTHEHFGHGRSDGLFIYCPDFDIYVKHSSFLFKRAKLKYSKLYKLPPKSFFLSGESLGGAITIHQAIYETQNRINKKSDDTKEKEKEKDDDDENKQSDIDIDSDVDLEWTGVLLAAPMCGIDDNIRPPKPIENCFLHCIVPCCPKSRISPTADLSDFFLSKDSSQKARTKYYENNALFDHGKPRLITSKTFIKATTFIEENALLFTLPVLIFHSKDDKVTSPAKSQLFEKNCASKDKVCFCGVVSHAT